MVDSTEQMKPYGILNVMKDAMTGNLDILPTVETNRRLEICKGCPPFTALSTCDMCGCFMPAKVKLARATCPDRRW